MLIFKKNTNQNQQKFSLVEHVFVIIYVITTKKAPSYLFYFLLIFSKKSMWPILIIILSLIVLFSFAWFIPTPYFYIYLFSGRHHHKPRWDPYLFILYSPHSLLCVVVKGWFQNTSKNETCILDYLYLLTSNDIIISNAYIHSPFV